MVIKVRLIKPKSKYTPSFYRTSQIKFQSLSHPQNIRFRTKSQQKIIQHTNPWELMTLQDINSLAQRLQDKPQQLYQVVKENQKQKTQQYQLARRLKFNKLQFTPQQQQNQSISKNKPYMDINKFKNLNSKNPFQSFSRSAISLINIHPDDNHRSILSKINLKKLQYEKEMKSIIQNKRLILETDLPKISKIKILDEPKMRLKLNKTIDGSMNGFKNGKLPVWKMR